MAQYKAKTDPRFESVWDVYKKSMFGIWIKASYYFHARSVEEAEWKLQAYIDRLSKETRIIETKEMEK